VTMPLGVTAVMLPDLDFSQQIALCQDVDITHYSIRPRVIADDQRDQPWGFWGNHKFDLTPHRLVEQARQITRQLADAGMVPFGTNPATNIDASDDELKLHLEGAAAVRAGRVRVAAAPYPQGPFEYSSLLDRVVDRYRKIVAMAQPMGLKIVIETHHGSLASGPGVAMNICRHFDPSQLGVIFDMPNFAIEGNLAPHLAIAVLGNYIDHCHVGGARRTSGQSDGQGFRKASHEMCSLTQSDLHIPTWIGALHKANKHVPLVIEDFTAARTSEDNLKHSAEQLRKILDSLP